jgi:predicted nuclease of predicted toxin-antitoxin system
MIFWLDAQFNPDLAAWLGSRFGIIVKTLKEIGLRDASDEEIAGAARRFSEIVIITKDSDFAELIKREDALLFPRVMLVECGNLTKVETELFFARSFDRAYKQIVAGVQLVRVTDE